MVKLKAKNKEKDFPVNQAEKILNMPNQGGWELKSDDYEFVNGVIKHKPKKSKREEDQA